MIAVLEIIANSWPITFMVIASIVAYVANRRIKQAMDNSQAVRDIKAASSQVVVNRNREDY